MAAHRGMQPVVSHLPFCSFSSKPLLQRPPFTSECVTAVTALKIHTLPEVRAFSRGRSASGPSEERRAGWPKMCAVKGGHGVLRGCPSRPP